MIELKGSVLFGDVSKVKVKEKKNGEISPKE
jgi:hypothetical protein